MNWIIKTFQSSIGQKVIMGLTGIFLCTFLVVHVSVNFQLFFTMMSPKIKIAIADDHQVISKGVSLLFVIIIDFEIIFELSHGQEIIFWICRSQ